MTEHHKIAARAGYNIERTLPSASEKSVYLASQEKKFFVLKWAGEKELETMLRWSNKLAPRCREIAPGVLSMHYLQGRHPFFWEEGDFEKLRAMFLAMKNFAPQGAPLSDHIAELSKKYPEISFPEVWGEEVLLHGDLHPWNIFIYNKALMIDPRGLRGPLGFDVAFLSASLANRQEEFLERMSKEVGAPEALEWFLPLVQYRATSLEKYGNPGAARIARGLLEKTS